MSLTIIIFYSYCKGHAFMGHTDGLAHGLREWTPVADPAEEKSKVTPGHVTTVLFSPRKHMTN